MIQPLTRRWKAGRLQRCRNERLPTCRQLLALEKVSHVVLGGLGKAQDGKGKSGCQGKEKTGRGAGTVWNLPQL